MSPESVYKEYLSAIRAGDHRRAFEAVEHASRNGFDLATIYLRVLQPALREIGQLWEEGQMTVAEEHLATAITESAMARLYNRGVAPMTGREPTLVAAGAENERHDIGLRMVGDLLEIAGWNIIYLGGTVPVESLVRMIRGRRPEVVALSATIDAHVARVADAIRVIRSELGDAAPLIIVGGRPFVEDAELARRIGADLVARDAAEAVERLREYVGVSGGARRDTSRAANGGAREA